MPAAGRLGVEQLSPLCHGLRRTSGDRVGVDGAKTRTRRRKTLPSCSTSPLKPTPGLSGPPVPMFPKGPKGYQALEEYIYKAYPNADDIVFPPSMFPQSEARTCALSSFGWFYRHCPFKSWRNSNQRLKRATPFRFALLHKGRSNTMARRSS